MKRNIIVSNYNLTAKHLHESVYFAGGSLVDPDCGLHLLNFDTETKEFEYKKAWKALQPSYMLKKGEGFWCVYERQENPVLDYLHWSTEAQEINREHSYTLQAGDSVHIHQVDSETIWVSSYSTGVIEEICQDSERIINDESKSVHSTISFVDNEKSNKRWGVAADILNDSLLIWDDNSTVKQIPCAGGPRQMLWLKDSSTLIVLLENQNNLVFLKWDSQKETFHHLYELSTLPEGAADNAAYPSEIRLHPNGRIYVSNRLRIPGDYSDSIFSFVWNADRVIANDLNWSLNVEYCRFFNWDSTGEFLFAASQKGHSIQAFACDEFGRLELVAEQKGIACPNCLVIF